MIIFALICGFLFTNCDKVKDDNEIEGIYVGTYTWSNLTRGFSSSSTPTIELKEGKYTYAGLANGSYFDSGSGNFTVNGSKIIFELTYYDSPMEMIGVIPEWQLRDEYKYKFNGSKLIFSKTCIVYGDECKYEFELKRETNR